MKRVRLALASLASQSFPCVLLGALLAACGDRDHVNPFDPKNPETGGVPRVANAVAGDGAVELRWAMPSLEQPAKVRCSIDEGKGLRLWFEEPGAREGRRVLPSLENERPYAFLFEVQDHRGGWLSTAPDSARPGRARIWIADGAGSGIALGTPDGRDVAERFEEGSGFFDLALDARGHLFAPDFYGDRILELDADGARVREAALPYPTSVAASPNGGGFWGASYYLSLLTRFDAAGAAAWTDSTFGRIEDLCSDGADGVLVASRDGTLARAVPGQVLWRRTEYPWPAALAEAEGGSFWFLDRTTRRVYLALAPEYEVRASDVQFDLPIDVTSDGAAGAWVADYGAGAVVHLDGQLRESSRFNVDGVEGIAFDAAHERLWLTRTGVGVIEVRDPIGNRLASAVVSARPTKLIADWRTP